MRTSDFLRAIWGDATGYGELRVMGSKLVSQLFYRLPHEIDAAADMAETLAALDVYYGVLPRKRQGGKATDCVDQTRVLWADVDNHNFECREMALMALLKVEPLAQIIVDSGRGFHAYWRLDRPIPVAAAQEIMRGIERTVGSDAVHDAPRVLRVPGTLNHKEDPPIPVRVLRFDERLYRLADLTDLAVPTRDEPPEAPLWRDWPPPTFSELPEWLRRLIREPTRRGRRSEAAFRVCLWLARYGWRDDEIERVFQDHPQGIGEKYHEKGRDGRRWLRTTLRAAREAS